MSSLHTEMTYVVKSFFCVDNKGLVPILNSMAADDLVAVRNVSRC